MADVDNLLGSTRRVVEVQEPLNNCRGVTYRVLNVGGGSEQHNLGWYATQAALEEAHPTATAGDWAIVGSTDSVWLWDTDNEEWVDSDQKGQVTSVNGQTGDVVLDLLPSQTGQSGKFLTTDGTDASWATPSGLQNTATGTNSLTLLGTAATQNNAINIGVESYSDYGTVSIGKASGKTYSSKPNIAYGVFVGQEARGGSGTTDCRWSVAVGNASSSQAQGGVAIGASALVSAKGGIAIGQYTQTLAQNAILLNASGTSLSNSDANTFKVGNANGNFEIMSADGTIPEARLADMTSAAQGQVLTLDSNSNAVWETPTTITFRTWGANE
jgi:hypothetical protein